MTALDLPAIRALHAGITIVPLEEFPGYGVSSDGRFWSTATNWRGYGTRELTQQLRTDGYLKVIFSVDGRRVNRSSSVLVAKTFLGPKPTPEHEVRHLDGDKLNNTAANLAWGTRKENAADRDLHGTTARGTRSGMHKLTPEEVRDIRDRYSKGIGSHKTIGAQFGVHAATIRDVVLRRSWKHV